MNIKPIAYFHSPLTSKFGLPRQSGLADDLVGRIVLEPEYRREEAVRGLEQFASASSGGQRKGGGVCLALAFPP